MTHTRPTIRALGLAAALALTLGLAACGDSDDDDGDAGAAASQAPPATPAEDRRAARAALESIYDALYAGDGKTFCAGLTSKAATDTGNSLDEGRTCEDAIRALVPRPLPPSAVKQGRSTIVGVEVDGDRATVTTQDVNPENPRAKLPFVRQDGEWKLDEKADASVVKGGT